MVNEINVELNKRLLRIVSDYENPDISDLDYLQSLALNIRN